MTAAALWTCARCGRGFANRNQSHTCGLHDLDAHFARRPPAVRALFDRVVEEVRRNGPVTILPEKTRIALQTRMSFMALMPRNDGLRGHLVLARRVEDPRWLRVETFSPRNHLHAFFLRSAGDIDDAFRTWIAEAYAVGDQKHLRRSPEPPA